MFRQLSAGLVAATFTAGALAAAPSKDAIVEQYADLALETYNASLKSAKKLDGKIETFLDNPSQNTLEKARAAWIDAREDYQQSEVFRFGNPVVDDWEGQLNAWPLDEGLIDYVDGDYIHELGNPGATANLIANTELQVGSETLDVSEFTPELLASLNELGGSEANVATGYHAIEFLLWGQDLNGTAAGAGERPYTDFASGEDCTHGHCDRRRDYLATVSDLLIQDLEWMVAQWDDGQSDNYRATLLNEPTDNALRRVFYGMGSLALGELAGERMKVALSAFSTEDEHDCFSDNTHNSHFYNARGIRNVYTGTFGRFGGGPSIRKFLKDENPELAERADEAFANTEAALQRLVDSAEQDDVHFDQLIAMDNTDGHEMVRSAIDALVVEARVIEDMALALGIDRLNPDNADHDF
ncbi:imelysin family protein [Saccharospirillum salsuginis]|uniref:Peptidase n=1 Tax=Saccharospirillum salsuginis TaxID=418750 RepID=A0A918KTN8_9GAMM|nr:imelysin family protein [Saccharospirillum salsuginis]GGX73150.1 peptidase [Saccharospirillum salsuginis]